MPRRAFDPMVAIRESAAHDYDHDYDDAELDDESEPEVESQLPRMKQKVNPKPVTKAASDVEAQFAKGAAFLRVKDQKIGCVKWWKQILSLDQTWTMIREHTPKALLKQRMPCSVDINDHLMADKAAAKENALKRKRTANRTDNVSDEQEPPTEDMADEMAESMVQPEMPVGLAFPHPLHMAAQTPPNTSSGPVTRNARKASSKQILYTAQDNQTMPDFGPHNHAQSCLPQSSTLESSFHGNDPTDPTAHGRFRTPMREERLEKLEQMVQRAMHEMQDLRSNEFSVDDPEAEKRVSAPSSDTKTKRLAKDVSSTQSQLQGPNLTTYEQSDTIILRQPTQIKDELAKQSTGNARKFDLMEDDVIEVTSSRPVKTRTGTTRIKPEPVEEGSNMKWQREEEKKAKIVLSEERRQGGVIAQEWKGLSLHCMGHSLAPLRS